MRGEDNFLRWAYRLCRGSPPHARGRLTLGDKTKVVERITPACAGKTISTACGEIILRDHPRMRGEDGGHAGHGRGILGSPPHARGRQTGEVTIEPRTGITPACAGKTSHEFGSRRPWRDHPRMRGEDGTGHRDPVHPGGSPPHARGRQCRPCRPRRWRRITPACAGKTQRLLPNSSHQADHPRMRGEDEPNYSGIRCAAGSPPHARGRRRDPRRDRCPGGITPACAGKTVCC